MLHVRNTFQDPVVVKEFDFLLPFSNILSLNFLPGLHNYLKILSKILRTLENCKSDFV
jgi:hypothetical protein